MYASKALFGGQAATAGRTVVVNFGFGPRAGIIMEVSVDDTPEIHVFGRSPLERPLTFVGLGDPASADSMPIDTWGWPPIVRREAPVLREGHKADGSPNGRFA